MKFRRCTLWSPGSLLATFALTILLNHESVLALEFSAQPTTQEISRVRVFEEPLAPSGGKPTTEENAALASALREYVERKNPDDFSSLTQFIETHPKPDEAMSDGPNMIPLAQMNATLKALLKIYEAVR